MPRGKVADSRINHSVQARKAAAKVAYQAQRSPFRNGMRRMTVLYRLAATQSNDMLMDWRQALAWAAGWHVRPITAAHDEPGCAAMLQFIRSRLP